MSSERKALFYKKELNLLNGPGKRNSLILSAMLFLTLIGLGHSVGGLDNLKKRMDNPFTNWINLPINPNRSEESFKLKEYFSDPENRAKFDLDTVRGTKTDYLKSIHRTSKQQFSILSRTIDPDEKLFNEILKKSNTVHLNDLDVDLATSCWVVVKKETLEKLGYTSDFSNINLLEILDLYGRNEFDENQYFNLFIPVLAIVQDLPDLADVLISDHFSELLFSSYADSGFIRLRRNNQFQLLCDDENKINGLTQSVGKVCECNVERLLCDEIDINGSKKQLCTVYMDSIYDTNEKLEFIKKLSSENGISGYTEYECENNTRLQLVTENNLAFNLSSLNKVRLLRQFIKDEFTFEISINQVEDKENFALVAKLTALISVLLFFLSLIGVLVFVVKILVSHLEKVQHNLGTFKAFGLSNHELLNDYKKILLIFTTVALSRSIAFAAVYWFISYLLNFHFNLFHWSILLSIIILLVSVRIASDFTLKAKLIKTPGDLVYGR